MQLRTYICSIFITELFIAIGIRTSWRGFPFFNTGYQLLSTRSAHSVTTGELYWIIEESMAAETGVASKVFTLLEDFCCNMHDAYHYLLRYR